jgi:hypothetical protein
LDFEAVHAAKLSSELKALLALAIDDGLNRAIEYFKKKSISITGPDLALMRKVINEF